MNEYPVHTLEPVALAALEAGRALMESGGTARDVEEMVADVAAALGAERVDVRIGYASLAITVAAAGSTLTRMCKVGHLGVNQRLFDGLHRFSTNLARSEKSPSEAQAGVAKLVRETPRHPASVTAIAVGLGCAAFGRLLNVDWAGAGAVFAAATLAQCLRRHLSGRQVNPFIAATLIAFAGSVLGGLGARWLGSGTVDVAMVASVLLLVPGVPALNAQADILQGRPTLGSARAVWVLVMLVFITVGLWVGQMVLREGL